LRVPGRIGRLVQIAHEAPIAHVAFCLFLALLCVFNANLRQISSDDTRAARYVPMSLLREGNLELSEYFPPASEAAPPYYLKVRGSAVYDNYPPIGPLLALPVYAPIMAAGLLDDDYVLATLASKVAASVQASLAVALFLLFSCRLVGAHHLSSPGGRSALFAALTLGLATGVWTTGSQGLYTHAPALLGLCGALLALVSGHMVVAGAAIGAAAVARPVLALVVVFLAATVATTGGAGRARRLVRFAFGAGCLALLGFGYNFWLHGNLIGGVGGRTEWWLQTLGIESLFAGNLPGGLAGLLLNPSRGLFVHSPILLLACAGAYKVWRRPIGPTERALSAVLMGRVAVVSILATTLVYAKFSVWWGGHGFGAKYLTDVLPFFALLVPFGYGDGVWLGVRDDAADRPRLRPATIRWVAALFVLSVTIQVIGATSHPSSWLLSKDPPYYERLWDWRYNQIYTCLSEGPRFDPTARRLFARLGLLHLAQSATPNR